MIYLERKGDCPTPGVTLFDEGDAEPPDHLRPSSGPRRVQVGMSPGSRVSYSGVASKDSDTPDGEWKEGGVGGREFVQERLTGVRGYSSEP